MFTIHKTPQPPVLITMGKGKQVVAPEVNQKAGRVKMAEEKKLGHETGVKKISQEPADKQGPIGTNPSPPASPSSGEDVKVGDKEGAKNE